MAKRARFSRSQLRMILGLTLLGAGGGGLLLAARGMPSAAAVRAIVTGDERVDEIAAAYSWASIARAADVVALADELGADAYDLAALLTFESGGSPTAINPRSGASGLIQFMPSTARWLGTTVEAIRGMGWSQQIPYVRRYLEAFADRGLYPAHKLALSVFYPDYMSRPIDTPFPEAVQESNPGIVTPRDYLRLMAGHARLPLTVAV